jgi:hypothetical protein
VSTGHAEVKWVVVDLGRWNQPWLRINGKVTHPQITVVMVKHLMKVFAKIKVKGK